jgi:predicted secreted protein
MRCVAWRIFLVGGTVAAMAAVGGLSEARSAATADSTKPTCSAALTAGPPQQVTISVQDTGSGLVSIIVTNSSNADTAVPAFSPGTTNPVFVTATKIDQTQTAVVRLIATDGDGNTQYCYVSFSPLVQSSEPTGPSCASQETAGPPLQVTTTIQDLESGLASILVTKSQNADTVVPPFTLGTTGLVVTTSTRIDQTQLASIEIRVIDLAGTVRICSFTFGTLVTAVQVRALTAAAAGRGAVVRWQTASEFDALGFHVYRSRGHAWKRLTHTLIVAKGSVAGASYRFLDRTAKRGVAYRYRIKAVNRDGTTSWFGPVRVT